MHGSGRTSAGVLASLGAAAAIAAATADARSLGAVTAPSASGLTRDGTTEIAVRAAPRVRLVGAQVDGRAVGLQRRGGKLRGRVRTGPGMHELRVELRRGGRRTVLQRRFAVAGRRSRLVTVAAPRWARRAPVPVRVRQNGRRLLRRLTVRLNGRTITRHFVDSAGFAETDRLSARHGLRHGVNRLEVLAIGRSGGWDRERRRIVLRRGVPIPDAGPDRRRLAGRAVRLRSRADGAHRWTLAARPRGSRARIRDGQLETDVPGRYRVRHVVRARGRRSGADVMEVRALPDAPPIGLPIDTMATQGGQTGVLVGDDFYQRDAGTLQVIEIDRATAAMVNTWSFSTDAAGFGDLAQQLSTLPSGQMIVVAADTVAAVGEPVATGLDDIGLYDDVTFGAGPFSAIGVTGMPSGQGTMNQAFRTLDGTLGALTGYLSLDSTGDNFQFTNPDTVPFDTNTTSAGNGATAVTATLGGQPCTTTLNTPNSAGFLTLAVDAGTLDTLSCTGFVTLNSGNDAGMQVAMANWLQHWTPQPWVLVLVQSIGDVHPTAPEWDQIADQIAVLGGSEHVFNTVDGGYSFVGGASAAPAETSTTLYPGTLGPVGTRLTGVLQRNGQFSLEPALHGPMTVSGTVPDFVLPQLAFQPATPWPNGVTGTTAAANAYIAQQLGLQADPSGTYDVRANYIYENFDFPVLARATGFRCPSGGGSGFSEADCRTMVRQFKDESGFLDQLDQYLGTGGLVQAPFVDAQTGDSDLLNAIANRITDAVDPPSSGGTTVFWESIVEEVLDDVVILAAFVPGGDAAAPALGLVASAFGIGGSFAKNPDGTAASELTTDADQLGLESDASFDATVAGLGRLRDIVATDWGKLRQFAIQSSGGNPAWDIADGSDAAVDGFKTAAKQGFYSALLADAYAAVQLPSSYCPNYDSQEDCFPQTTVPTTSARTYNCAPTGSFTHHNAQPFSGLASDGSGEFDAVTGFNDDMTPVYTVQALTQASSPADLPPASLTTPLLQTPQSGDDLNGGFNQPQLWRAFQPPLSFASWNGESNVCAYW